MEPGITLIPFIPLRTDRAWLAIDAIAAGFPCDPGVSLFAFRTRAPILSDKSLLAAAPPKPLDAGQSCRSDRRAFRESGKACLSSTDVDPSIMGLVPDPEQAGLFLIPCVADCAAIRKLC
jgi:hypothetical protein